MRQGTEKYWDATKLIGAATRTAFPSSSSEIAEAGKAYCFEMADAAVFHCSRAYEGGARAMAVELKCEFGIPFNQVDLHPLLNNCEAKIQKMKDLPKSDTKAADIEFYSLAAANFRYFKDGWRIRAVHGRASFSLTEAERLIDRTVDFFEVLSRRLHE